MTPGRGLVIGHGYQPFHIVVCAFQPVGDARVGDLRLWVGALSEEIGRGGGKLIGSDGHLFTLF